VASSFSVSSTSTMLYRCGGGCEGFKSLVLLFGFCVWEDC
jgi:hypothetical protein